MDHILAQCVYARETWHRCFDVLNLPTAVTTPQDRFLEWWMAQRQAFQKEERRGFDTLVIFAMWSMWKQRNARVFNRREQQLDAQALTSSILEEIKE